ACEARGIELSSRGAQQLTQEMADKADIIIAVHEKQQQRIEELFPDAKHKIRLIHMISTMDEIVGAGIVGNDPLRAHHIKQVEEAMDDINGWISEAIIAKVAAKASSAGTPAINWAVNNIEELEQACRQAMTEFNNEFPEDYLKKLQRAHRGIIASINKYMRTLRRDSLTYRILEDYRSKLEQDHNDAMDTAYVYCYANWPDETVASSELSVSAVVHGGFKRPAAYDENSQKAEDVLSEWQDDALSAVLEARDATRAAVWQAERDLYENIVAMDSAEKAAASAEEQLENVSESLAHKETFLSKKYEDAVQDETSVAKRVLIKRLVSDVAQLTDEKEALEEQALEQRRLQSQAAERLPGLQKQVLDQGRELQGLEDEINRMLGLRFDDATDEFVCFEEHLYWHIFLGANRTDASEQIVKDAIRESLGQAETATARGFQELACREMAEEMSQSERIDTGNAIGLERLLTHIARNSHAQAIVAQACGADFAKLHKRHRLFKALRKIAATLALGGAIVWGVHKRLQVEQPPAPKPVTRSLTMLHLRKEEIEAMPEYHKKGEEGEEAEGAKKKTPRQLLTGAMAGAGHIAAASRKYSEERKKALERRREKLANMEARLKELRIREKKLAQSVPMLPEELSQELDVLAESAAKLDDSLRKERVDERVFPDKLYDVLAGEKDTKAETAAAVAREREKEVQEDLASMSRAFKESAAAYADGADAPHSGPRIIAYTKGGKRYLTETVYGIVNPPKGKFFLEDSKWGLWATGKAGSATVFSTMCPSMPGMLAFPAQNVVRIPVFPGHVIESIKTELENVNGRVYFDRANSMWAVVFSGYPKYIEIGMRLAQQGEIEELPQMQIDPEVADTWQDSLPDEMREILSIARGMPVEQRQIIREMVLGMFFGTENTYLRQLSEEEPDFVKMSFTYFAHKCDGFEKVHAFVSHGLRLPTQAHYGFKDANKDGVFVELEGHAWAQTPHGTEDVGTLARIFSSQSGKKFNRAEHLKELAWIKKTAEYRRQQMEGVLELVRQMKNSIAFEAQIKQEKKATVAAEAAFAQEGWKKSYFDLQRFYHAKLSFFEPRAIFTPAEAHEFLQEAMQARHELQGLVGKDAEFMALSHFLFTSINRVKNAFPELAGIADLVKRELAQDIDNALPKDRRLKEPIGPWAEPIVVGSGYNADVLEHAALLRKRLPLAPEMIDIRNDPEGSLRSLGLGADGVNRLKQGEIVFSPDGMFTYQLNSAADHLYVWTPEDNLAVSDTVTGEEIENLALASGELSRITDYVQGLAAYGIARPVTLAASTGAFPANAQAYAKTQSVAGSRWFDFWASQPQPSVLVSATMFNRAKSVKIHSPLSMKGDWLAEITFEDGTVVFDGPMADEADVRSDGQQIKQYKERQGLWFFPDGTWLGLVRDLSGKFRFIGTISFSTGARIDDFEMDDCHAVFCRETGEWWALGKVNGKWVKFEVIREGIGSSHKGRSQLDFGLTGLEGVKSIGAIVHPDKDAWIAHVLLETGVWVRRGPGIKQFNLAADDTFTQKTYDEAHMRYERNMGLYGYRVTEYERCYEIFVQERTNRAGVRVGVCSGEETKRLRVGGKALSERGWETITMPYLMPDGRYDYRLLIDDNQLMYLGGSFAEEFNLNNRAFRYIEKDGLHKPRIRFFGEDGWAIMVTHLKGHVGVIYKPSGSQQVHEKSFEGLATELQMLRWIKDFVCSEDGSWAMSYFSTGGYKIRGSAAVMAQIGGPQYFRSVYGLYLQDGIFLKAFVKQGGKLKVLSALGEQELPAHLQSYDFYKLHVADNEGNWMIEMRKVAGNKTLFQFYGPLANKLRRQSDQLGDPLLQFSGESGRHTEVKKLDNGTIVAVITGDVDIQHMPPIGSSVGLRESPLADSIVFSTDPQADFLTRLEGMYD
ncbi:MAG: hypothetical protein HQ558_01460, partial [Candidatus Omnitrophica bacterium]|nr:hypothetical protein [Candidatus Omnitrophota bacterium]